MQEHLTIIQKVWISVAMACAGRAYLDLQDCTQILSDEGYRSLVNQLFDYRKAKMLNPPSEQEILVDFPAHARAMNIALAQSDIRVLQQELECLHLGTDIEQMILSFVRRGYPWGDLSSPLWDGDYLTDAKNLYSSVSSGVTLGATFLTMARQLLGLYARCTRPFEQEQLTEFTRKANQRLTEEVDLNEYYRIGLSFFGAACFDDDLDQEIASGRLQAGFGPGATSELSRTKSWRKSALFGKWNELIDLGIPDSYFRLPMEDDPLWIVHAPSYKSHNYSKMRAVPKDFRGPRLIAAEPTVRSYVSRGVAQWLIRGMRKAIPGAVNLRDQSLNQDAAREGSISGSVCTIDLSDASDTVRDVHVEAVFNRLPGTLKWLKALKTPYVQSLDGSFLKPTTFCTMGNFVCFPLETLVYLGIITVGLWSDVMGADAINRSTLRKFLRKTKLRAYGDDLIVATEYADKAISSLREAGMHPNDAKCCLRGHFRESCGFDACWGANVTPLRPRELPGASESTLSGLHDIIQNFLDANLPEAALCVYAFTATTWKVRFPVCPDYGSPRASSGLLYASPASYELLTSEWMQKHPFFGQFYGERDSARVRRNSKLQRMEVLVPYERVRYGKRQFWQKYYYEFLRSSMTPSTSLPPQEPMDTGFRGNPLDSVDKDSILVSNRWVAVPVNWGTWPVLL